MAEVLGRVTGTIADKRGPDAIHRVRVPAQWLHRGEAIAVELPRNLTCAACEGGGCDLCQRAGATSLRGRNDPPESLQLTLPVRNDLVKGSSVVLRIPDRGGLPTEVGVESRGVLLLRIEVAPEADAEVHLMKSQRMSLVELAVSKKSPPLLRLAVLVGAGLLLWLLVALLLHLIG